MTGRSTAAKTFSPERISGPIPLIVCLGLVCESIVGGIAYLASSNPIFPYVAIFSLMFPIFLIGVIFRLISKHFSKLYPPQSFKNPDDFLNLVRMASESMVRVGQTNQKDIFRPLGGDQKVDTSRSSNIDIRFGVIEDTLNALSSSDFLVFHGWFNAEERHELALLCIDIAIAKGATDARNFSFRSASLRKLNRLLEAVNSAGLALEINPGDLDAIYNLGRAKLGCGDLRGSQESLKLLERAGAALYVKRLSAAITDHARMTKT